MVHAIRIHRYGGPEALSWDEVDLPAPGTGEALIRQSAIGLNFIDIYQRDGLYALPALPAILGNEGAGVVEAIGPGVSEVAIGDRVAYAGGPIGAYAEKRVMPAARLVRVPDGITDEQAASMMLQGMTAWYLLHRTHKAVAGETILVHAAAGGVGLILCQWAKALGVRVIGLVSTAAKADLARAHGCDHPMVYGDGEWSKRVREIAPEGLPVVYDSVGKDTFEGSLDCLRPLGLMVSYGNASGPVPPFAIGTLAAKGSLFLTRPSLAHYTASRADLEAASSALFEVVRSGKVQIRVNQRFALKDAAEAHQAMASRQTTGSTVLMP